MGGRANFHRLFRDIDIGELFELVIHARQFLFDVLGPVRNFFLDPRDVEKDSAVGTAPALFDFAHNATRNVVAR